MSSVVLAGSREQFDYADVFSCLGWKQRTVLLHWCIQLPCLEAENKLTIQMSSVALSGSREQFDYTDVFSCLVWKQRTILLHWCWLEAENNLATLMSSAALAEAVNNLTTLMSSAVPSRSREQFGFTAVFSCPGRKQGERAISRRSRLRPPGVLEAW